MDSQQAFREIAILRLQFKTKRRLQLEFLSSLSSLFRAHDVPVADELLSEIVLATGEELPGVGYTEESYSPYGTALNGNSLNARSKNGSQSPAGKRGAPPQPPGVKKGAPPQPPSGKRGAPPQPPGGKRGAPPQPLGGKRGAPPQPPSGKRGAPPQPPGGKRGAPPQPPGGRRSPALKKP